MTLEKKELKEFRVDWIYSKVISARNIEEAYKKSEKRELMKDATLEIYVGQENK